MDSKIIRKGNPKKASFLGHFLKYLRTNKKIIVVAVVCVLLGAGATYATNRNNNNPIVKGVSTQVVKSTNTTANTSATIEMTQNQSKPAGGKAIKTENNQSSADETTHPSEDPSPGDSTPTPVPQPSPSERICNDGLRAAKRDYESASYNVAISKENNNYDSQMNLYNNKLNAALQDLSNRGLLNSGGAEATRNYYAKLKNDLTESHNATLNMLEKEHELNLSVISSTCY